MNISDSLASRTMIGWTIAIIAAVIFLSSIFAVVPETKM